MECYSIDRVQVWLILNRRVVIGRVSVGEVAAACRPVADDVVSEYTRRIGQYLELLLHELGLLHRHLTRQPSDRQVPIAFANLFQAT